MQSTLPITKQVFLAAFQPGDKEALIQYLNDPVLYANTLKIPSPYTALHAEEWLQFVAGEKDAPGGICNWSIRHQEYGLIGGIGCFLKTGMNGHVDEIGYWLAQPFRGQGIMTTVVQRFTQWMFEQRPSLVRIEANVFATNPASIRILEKAGFLQEGYHRKVHLKAGEYLDGVIMAKVLSPES
ncbi:MAG: GNAT family N-acetyltransferase [Saprospiraceae bacterium]|nr:GNAT family N-acetyltransferase [Saprospiraceae bacterium]